MDEQTLRQFVDVMQARRVKQLTQELDRLKLIVASMERMDISACRPRIKTSADVCPMRRTG